jgi:iduronate 2-sulfatase
MDLTQLVDRPALAADRPPLSTWGHGNYAVRREQWRYIRYKTGDKELYDHSTDPDEYVNLSAEPSYAPIMAELDPYLPQPD